MTRRKSITYHFNPETCTYQKAEPTTLNFFKQYSGYFFTVAFVSVAALYFYFAEFHTVKENLLLNEQEILLSKMELQNQRLATLGSDLDQLFEKDKQVYNPILSAEKIPKSIWEGGVGGFAAANKDANIEEKTSLHIKVLQHRLKLLKANYYDLELLFEKTTKDLRKMPCILPVKGKFISGFGRRVHPISGGIHFHTGLDFKCPTGTPIYATGDGVIATATYNANGYGINVDIDHLNGYQTKYAHMSKLNVRKGQAIKRGEVIGYSGNTGMSTGPHLHYEIKENDVKIDPLDFFYFDLFPGEFLQLKLQSQNESISLDY